MSKPRVQVDMIFKTMVGALSFRSTLSSQLIGKNIFDLNGLLVYTNDSGKPAFHSDVRFNIVIDRDTIRDQVHTFISSNSSASGKITSGRLYWHTCTHDDSSSKNCRTTDYAEITA